MTDEIRQVLREQLADALSDYRLNSNLAARMATTDGDDCDYCTDADEDAAQCSCDVERDRAAAGVHAQLANAAAVMAQAMATLLAAPTA